MAGRLSIGTAWTEAAAFVRAQRRLLAPVVLGLILLPSVVSTMVQPQATAGKSPEPGLWMLIAFLMILVMMVGQLAIVLLIDGWRGSVGEAIARALRRLPALVLAALLVIGPLLLISSVLLALTGLSAGGDGRLSPESMGGGTWLTILLLMAVSLFIAVRLMPIVPVIAVGSDGPVAALKRTFRMTSGSFWKLVAFFLLMIVAFLIAGLAVGAVLGTLIMLTLGKPEAWSVSMLLIAIAGGFVQAAFITIYTAMLARVADQLGAGERVSE